MLTRFLLVLAWQRTQWRFERAESAYARAETYLNACEQDAREAHAQAESRAAALAIARADRLVAERRLEKHDRHADFGLPS